MMLKMADDQLLFEGAVLQTDHQTHGKGQRGNKWYSAPDQNLTFSVLLKPVFLAPKNQFELNRIASLAIFSALREFFNDDELKIKWPNDIYVNQLKIGGILIENSLVNQSITRSIIGIGLNINQLKMLPKGATSLINENRRVYEKEEILVTILQHLEKFYFRLKEGQHEIINEQYLKQLYRLNYLAAYEDQQGAFLGTILGVDKSGLLEVQKQNGALVTYQFKEVVFK